MGIENDKIVNSQGTRVDGGATAPPVVQGWMDTNSVVRIPQVLANAAGGHDSTLTRMPGVVVDLHLYDPNAAGNHWLPWPGNQDVANLAVEASSVASRTGADQVNLNAKGMYLHQRVLTAVGTNFGYLPHVQAKMNDGSYITIWSAAAFQTAVGDKVWLFYPGASGVAAAAGLTGTVNLPIPRTWRALMAYSADGTAQTLMDHSYIW